MKDRLMALRPIILRVVGYPVFFVFFFVMFLYVTFPYQRLAEFIVAQAEAPRVLPSGRVIPSTLQLNIGHLGPTFFPGLKAQDVTLTMLPQRAGETATTMRIDTAAVHVSLFGLLARKANISFALEGMGGTIEGSVSASLAAPSAPTDGPASATRAPDPASPLRDLNLTLAGVRVGDIAPLRAMVGLPMGGNMSGTVEIHIPDGQVNQTEGAVHLTAERLTLGDGHAQYQIPHFGGVTIEQIRAGRLDLNVTIRRGVAVFDRVGSHSEELDLQIDGRAEMRPNLADTTLNLGVRFRLTDVYRAKSEVAGRILSVMDMVPDIRRARRPDGMLALRCTGTIDRGVQCPPDTRAAGAGAGAPAPTAFAP